MNGSHPIITIDLVLDRHSTKEVLHAILHSILFHRLFGTVKPQTFEVFDVTMPGVDDKDMEQLVDDKVDAFWKGIEGGSNKRGQIIITFSEKKPKKSWFQVYMGEEEVPWEQWRAFLQVFFYPYSYANHRIVNAEIRQPKSERDRQAFNTNISTTLTKALQTMLTHTSSEKGRSAVPLITSNTGISPFPIKIVVKVDGVEVG